MAIWVTDTFAIEAFSLRDIGLRDAKDIEIFEAAKIANVIIMTKDSDFVDLVCRYSCYLRRGYHQIFDH